MSVCKGCYRPDIDGYCTSCRKALFDGAKVSAVLDFDAQKDDNISLYLEKSKRLSISGVQLKYSLRLERKRLVLTDTNGGYILKPIPPAGTLQKRDQAPENEHLTMQIASKVFKINTAANGVIYFKDGNSAYLTRRFDIRPDGKKYLQEDMAQLSGKTRHTLGENFKYEGTYEDIGLLIKKHVAASIPVLENYFRLVLFNYLFSNGDAHLKNFSVYQTEMFDYTLTPAYDLMCTSLHIPDETDTALHLYAGDQDTTFYKENGYYAQAEFRKLAEKIGLLPKRVEKIITQMLSSRHEALEMIQESFLNEESKEIYADAYLNKLKRMGMTRTMIARIIDKEHPRIYTDSETPVILGFKNGTATSGFFVSNEESYKLEKENKYNFVKNSDAINYQITKDKKNTTIVDGDSIVEVKMVNDSNP
jgi:serine/threonine-protein kinase HipA